MPKPEVNKAIDFERITLSITGTMAATREYELLKTPDGLLATEYYGQWNYDENIKREDCQTSSFQMVRQ